MVTTERPEIIVVELWPGEPIDCAMCGAEIDGSRLSRRYGVPWYCGPVLESEGGRDVCRPCYERWMAWYQRMCYWGA